MKPKRQSKVVKPKKPVAKRRPAPKPKVDVPALVIPIGLVPVGELTTRLVELVQGAAKVIERERPEAERLVGDMKGMRVITSAEQLDVAKEHLQSAKAIIDRVQQAIEPLSLGLHRAHKAATAYTKVFGLCFEFDALRSVVSRYVLAEQRKRDEIARQNALIQEQQRQQAEDAGRAALGGDTERAAEIMEQPTPATMEMPTATDTSGMRITKKWRVNWEATKIDDIKREYMVPDEVRINKIVRTMGPAAKDVIGGIVIEEDASAAVL